MIDWWPSELEVKSRTDSKHGAILASAKLVSEALVALVAEVTSEALVALEALVAEVALETLVALEAKVTSEALAALAIALVAEVALGFTNSESLSESIISSKEVASYTSLDTT